MRPGVHSPLARNVHGAYKRLMAVLETIMRERGWKDEDLAARVNISRVHASRLRRRLYLPSPALAKELERVTQVPAERFLYDQRAA